VTCPAEISLLEKRRLEGEIIKPIFTVLTDRCGLAAAKEIIAQAIKNAALESGRQQAAVLGGGNLANLIALQPMWQKGGALKVQVLAETDCIFDYNVTYCAYAEMYKNMGLGDLGFILSCNRDEAFILGFAPDIKLTRTQTIMEGAAFCDFRYKAGA
jgi:hypothetical protein